MDSVQRVASTMKCKYEKQSWTTWKLARYAVRDRQLWLNVPHLNPLAPSRHLQCTHHIYPCVGKATLIICIMSCEHNDVANWGVVARAGIGTAYRLPCIEVRASLRVWYRLGRVHKRSWDREDATKRLKWYFCIHFDILFSISQCWMPHKCATDTHFYWRK